MLGHLGINVVDLRAAKAYYDALLPLLGFTEFVSADDEFAYRPAGGKPGTYLFFYPSTEDSDYSQHRTGLQHLAFMVARRSELDDVHRVVKELIARFGGRVLHAPREFPEYPPPYYATFWLDPWGFMLEAVCHYDRD
jgi:catechol 2,3-dioxygenase-like lactoylglutathione lyase family enzyme